MGQTRLIASLIMISIFTIAIISYVTYFSIENNSPVNFQNDSSFYSVDKEIRGNITVFQDDVNSSSEAFSKSTVTSGSDNFESPTVFQTLFFIPKTMYSILSLINEKIFGGDERFFIVTGSLSIFIVVISVLYIWKTFRGGDPD